MSVESMAIALHHSRASGTAKVVLLGIANHDGDGGAWPSIATLAKYANVTERNVQTALRKLEALGEIETHKQQGGLASTPHAQRPNRYVLSICCPPNCDRTTAHRLLPTVDKSEAQGVTKSTPGDEIDTRGGVAGDTLTTPITKLSTGHSPSPHVTTSAPPVDNCANCANCRDEIDPSYPAALQLALCPHCYAQPGIRTQAIRKLNLA